jgi:signal transduction histidine kinase
VLVSIAVAVYFVTVAVTSQAELELRSGLDQAASLVDDYGRAQFDNFVRLARLVADLPKLKAAVSEDDPPTVTPIAADYQQQINADLFVVVGKTGRVLARLGSVMPDPTTLEDMLRAHLTPTGQEATWLWPFSGGVLKIAAIPLSTEPGPESLGTLVVGFRLDQLAQRIKDLTDSDIALVAGSRIVTSTLDPARTTALAGAIGQHGVFVRPLGDEEYIGRVQSLGSADAPDELVALVLRSRTERLRFLRQFYVEIAATGVAAVLVATLLGYAIARTVTRPLRAVTKTMGEMAATGDLTRTPPTLGRWDDEDARLLATTFRQLTSALDRFQRLAARRERLSSLGRLSTVVAHEVRNPLMIIKAAMRSLRKHPSPDVVEVATSVDEEVSRLNRVVTDVLDFARPIRYEIAPADLIDICRDAALAAQAGPDSATISVEPAVSQAPIITDAERVRAVLVNVLTNSQHAVRTRGTTGAPDAIRVRIARGGDGRWAVDVIDQGGGIAATDLSRVFEPFFTTRRAGSGLGLALARNVVEGLGGAIAIDSQVDVGTTVRISLPDRASPAGTRP